MADIKIGSESARWANLNTVELRKTIDGFDGSPDDNTLDTSSLVNKVQTLRSASDSIAEMINGGGISKKGPDGRKMKYPDGVMRFQLGAALLGYELKSIDGVLLDQKSQNQLWELQNARNSDGNITQEVFDRVSDKLSETTKATWQIEKDAGFKIKSGYPSIKVLREVKRRLDAEANKLEHTDSKNADGRVPVKLASFKPDERASADTASVEEAISNLQSKNNALKSRLGETSSELLSANVEIANSKEKIALTEELARVKQQELEEVTTALQLSQTAMAEAEAQSVSLQTELGSTEAELASVRKSLTLSENEKQQTFTRAEKLQTLANQNLEKLNLANSELELSREATTQVVEERNFLLGELEQYKAELVVVRDQLTVSDKQRLEAFAKAEKLQESAEQSLSKIKDVNVALKVSKGVAAEAEAVRNSLQSELDQMKTEMVGMQDKLDKAERQKEEALVKVAEIEESAKVNIKKLQAKQADLENSRNVTTKIEAERDALQGELEGIGNELRATTDEKNLALKTVTESKKLLKRNEERADSAELEKDRALATVEETKEQLSDAVSQTTIVKEELASKINELDAAKENLAKYGTQAEQFGTLIQEMQNKIQAAENKVFDVETQRGIAVRELAEARQQLASNNVETVENRKKAEAAGRVAASALLKIIDEQTNSKEQIGEAVASQADAERILTETLKKLDQARLDLAVEKSKKYNDQLEKIVNQKSYLFFDFGSALAKQNRALLQNFVNYDDAKLISRIIEDSAKNLQTGTSELEQTKFRRIAREELSKRPIFQPTMIEFTDDKFPESKILAVVSSLNSSENGDLSVQAIGNYATNTRGRRVEPSKRLAKLNFTLSVNSDGTISGTLVPDNSSSSKNAERNITTKGFYQLQSEEKSN